MAAVKTTQKSFPRRSGDAPATQGMIIALKDAMNARFEAARHEGEARFKQVDARFEQVDARFEKIEAKLDLVLSHVSEMALQNEAQRSENRVVLEGLQLLFKRQDRVEGRLDEVHETLRTMARRPRPRA